MEKYEDPILHTLDYFHPLSLAAKANDQDNPNWSQATRGSNSNGFWKAMWIEIVILMKMKAFEIVPRQKDMH
eukprot:8745692-Ditylum_brightwellii.AAC.1